jgi:SAM-dependent methyltransferase
MAIDFMKDDGVFMPMLNDAGRNQFYKQALDLSAKDKIVCDVGAGTGLLSILAVQAGAKHVIAVERDADRFAYLNQNLQRLGLANQIETRCINFLHSDIQADVYVSETINTQIFGEDILKISNHVVDRGGQFIPTGFKIWAEVYQNHPVFILDLTGNQQHEFGNQPHKFDPGIDIDPEFIKKINQDFTQQYDLQQTVYTADQFNRLFTLLDKFDDLKLIKTGETTPIIVDLNQHNIENNIKITVPNNIVGNGWPMIVLKWEIFFQDIVLSSDKCWFGNVAKHIRDEFRTGSDVVFYYDPAIRTWKLTY